MSQFIKRPAHVALAVPDIDASVAWATTVMGLREVEREGGTVYLTHSDCHHSLQLIEAKSSGLDHISLEAHDGAALDALVKTLADAGIELLSQTPQEKGIDRAIRFKGPEGHVIEVFTGMSDGGPTVTGRGVQPRKFGHPMLSAQDGAPTVSLFLDTLGFRLSDIIRMQVNPQFSFEMEFYHCNARHHTLALMPVPTPKRLHHFMVQVPTLDAVGFALERAGAAGVPITATLGRHTNDQMVSFYARTPAGFEVEFGFGALEVDDAVWRVTRHDKPSTWGHKRPSH